MTGPEAVTGVVFNVQRFSVHDGPGIRTTVFLKGCPLTCPWCHNPEGLAAAPAVTVADDRCLACGRCADACPRPEGPLPAGAGLGDGSCQSCGRCVAACPTGARELAGQTVSVHELAAEVLRDRPFYDTSGGGVSFSGGEPLAQPEFLLACLQRCREEAVHTAVDTAGAADRAVVVAVAECCDLLLFDVKTMDPEAHAHFVGRPLALILENLRAAAEVGVRMWLRVPVVPGLTDGDESLTAVGRLAAGLPAVERVHLLPYHRTGTGKLDRLGRAHGASFVAPSPGRLEELAGIVRSAGVPVAIGG